MYFIPPSIPAVTVNWCYICMMHFCPLLPMTCLYPHPLSVIQKPLPCHAAAYCAFSFEATSQLPSSYSCTLGQPLSSSCSPYPPPPQHPHPYYYVSDMVSTYPSLVIQPIPSAKIMVGRSVIHTLLRSRMLWQPSPLRCSLACHVALYLNSYIMAMWL